MGDGVGVSYIPHPHDKGIAGRDKAALSRAGGVEGGKLLFERA